MTDKPFELTEVQKAYTKAFFEVSSQCAKIKQAIGQHNDDHPSPDWGDVGDLNAIVEQLKQITEGK